jgi:hypothetical protein
MSNAAAYGYISLVDDDERIIEILSGQLVAHAAAEGLDLVDIQVDRNVLPARLMRPGLTTLFTRLRTRAGRAVVLIPSRDHLSPWRPVRRVIEAELTRLGVAVQVAEAAAGRPDASRPEASRRPRPAPRPPRIPLARRPPA